MDKVAVLCVNRNSVYKKMDDVEAYDIDRDVLNFSGDNPIVAHPPCRAWSAFCSHQAKPLPGEKEIAPYCINLLLINGGVLEHPAHSKVFEHCNLPKPGKSKIINGCMVKTISVWQSWWGYPMRKATWLCFFNIDTNLIKFPYLLTSPGGDRRRQQLMSHDERAATTEAFARWLVDAARKRYCAGALPVGNSDPAFYLVTGFDKGVSL